MFSKSVVNKFINIDNPSELQLLESILEVKFPLSNPSKHEDKDLLLSLKTRLKNSICDPDQKIINKISKFISMIKLNISNIQLNNNFYHGINLKKFLDLKWNIGFVCNNKYENGLPHTRNNIIILNRQKLDMDSDKKIMKTLIHEQIHVYQKQYPNEVLKYLQNNNFTKIKEREENDNIRANPDLDNFIYQDENYNTYKAVYNNNPNSIEDITYYPYNEQYYEHPNERMAIEFENILNN